MKTFLKGDPRPGTRGIRLLMWGRKEGAHLSKTYGFQLLPSLRLNPGVRK